MNQIDPLSVFLAFLVLVALGVFYRLTNATIHVSWSSQTHDPKRERAAVEFTDSELERALEMALQARLASRDVAGPGEPS